MAQPRPPGDSNDPQINWINLSPSLTPTRFTTANISADIQDFLDIVKSQGAYLVPRPPTPLHQKQCVKSFVNSLREKLERIIKINVSRRKYYGDAADEWPPGHTPTELVDKRANELKALMAVMEAPSPPSDCEGRKGGLEEEQKQKSLHEAKLSQPRLPTPLPSSAPSDHQSPMPAPSSTLSEAKTTREKKRRLAGTDEDDGQRKKSRLEASVDGPRRSVRLRNARLRRGIG